MVVLARAFGAWLDRGLGGRAAQGVDSSIGGLGGSWKAQAAAGTGARFIVLKPFA